MSVDFQTFCVFEHPAFVDVWDAARQSRLHGWNYRSDHSKYHHLCATLKQQLPAFVLADAFERPMEAVTDNSALYVLRMSPQGRETVLPTLIKEAVALGFSVHDDMLGQCHCPAGVWTLDGLQPAAWT